ncbi:MAG: polyprenyl synthetase family protein [Eubacteriales bacterium]|nr:polyprenyl synthetase family protein [Eubacteriales bacterium]
MQDFDLNLQSLRDVIEAAQEAAILASSVAYAGSQMRFQTLLNGVGAIDAAPLIKLPAALDFEITDLPQTLRVERNVTSSLRSDLVEGMLYASRGGKKLRASLALLVSEMIAKREDLHDSTSRRAAEAIAIALESLHSYSLVHDDLPALDNDSMRRGQASCHCRYGEATAILIGDALLSFSFESLKNALSHEFPERNYAMLTVFSEAIGAWGMILGQHDDLSFENAVNAPAVSSVLEMALRKTALLIELSLRLPAMRFSEDSDLDRGLSRLGQALGLAFQIQDDFLDVEADPDKLGKSIGKDEAANKITVLRILGREESKRLLRRLFDCVDEELDLLKRRGYQTLKLESLIASLIDREA